MIKVGKLFLRDPAGSFSLSAEGKTPSETDQLEIAAEREASFQDAV